MTFVPNAPRIPNTEILTTLGTGGMGKVYLARFSRAAFGFEKLVAVKVVRPERMNQTGVEAMFVDEARLVARIDHPSVAQVFDFGRSEGAFYLVMEYVQGCSLGHLLGAGLRPPPLICATIVARVCRGLHAAHELRDTDGALLNVVHRDVTPSNLVLTFEGDVKILDFGIALMRARSAPTTGAGQIRGKPTYLAPEQVNGEAISRRTDIYALSIVLHELLTGEKLFRREDVMSDKTILLPQDWGEIAAQVDPPSKNAGPLPEGLDDVVMIGLSIRPEDRFVNARAMAQALETIIEREGTESLPSYVDRELHDLRAEHNAELRALLGGEKKGMETPPHPGTESALAAPRTEGTATELKTYAVRKRSVRSEVRPTTEHHQATPVLDRSPEAPQRHRRGGPGLLIVAMLLLILGVGGALYMRRPQPPADASIEPLPIPPPPSPVPRARATSPAEAPNPTWVADPQPAASPMETPPKKARVPKKTRVPKKRPTQPRRQASPPRTRIPKKPRTRTVDRPKRREKPTPGDDPDIITEW